MTDFETRDVIHNISSKHCVCCGGETDGWKCPQCGLTTERYDPLHFKKCSRGGKLRAKCKGCGKVEDNCACASS